MASGDGEDSDSGFAQLPGVQAPHQKLAFGGAQGGSSMDEAPQRDLPPYERGPPLSYMERIAMKRQLEEVCKNCSLE